MQSQSSAEAAVRGVGTLGEGLKVSIVKKQDSAVGRNNALRSNPPPLPRTPNKYPH